MPDALLGAENTEVNTTGPVPLTSQMEKEADLHGITFANGTHIYQGPPVNKDISPCSLLMHQIRFCNGYLL